jgi:hypothetical protein
MRRIIGLVLVGILVGASAQETFRPHGELSGGPRITQEAAPPPRHPYDAPFDVPDLREPIVRQATPTSANTVPAPVDADSAFAPVTQPPDPGLILFLSIALLLAPFSMPLFAWHQIRRNGGLKT